jgi:AcrR family transcriptional regulator
LSTSKIPHERYHHGDLRNVLLASGVQLLAEEGLEALSLRGLAKRAGVSHNAPYQHFADKEAFLAALAEQGFMLLGQAMAQAQEALAADLPITERLVALGQTYVQFALHHPSHMAVMFINFAHQKYPTLAEAAMAALAQLLHLVEQGQASGQLRPTEPQAIALSLWTILHGMSLLLIADKLPQSLVDGKEALQLTEQSIRHLCGGIVQAK